MGGTDDLVDQEPSMTDPENGPSETIAPIVDGAAIVHSETDREILDLTEAIAANDTANAPDTSNDPGIGW